MDAALAQLALFFVPGAIWAGIDSRYGSGVRHDTLDRVVRTFLFGAVANSILYLLFGFVEVTFYEEGAFGATSLYATTPEMARLFSAILLGFALAIGWLFAVKHRLLLKLLYVTRATGRTGHDDVWSFLFNSDLPSVEYVHVRDFRNNTLICGWVDIYSDGSTQREILLRDVVVFDPKGNVISRPPHLYLSRSDGDLWIELPHGEREKTRYTTKPGPVTPIFGGAVMKGGQNFGANLSERPTPPFDLEEEARSPIRGAQMR